MTALRNGMTDEELEAHADGGEPEKGRWSQTEMLLAGLDDRLARVAHVLICANSEKSKHPPDPEPMRRPGAAPRKKKPVQLTDQAAERLFHLINGGAA
ncbi:MAG TPA: hypothetical protein VFH77_06495 [Streptomyces sp.]|nr:hypothetical protein [Streptomyces sp.]